MAMTKKTRRNLRNLTYSAACLALCIVLPFATGQIPQVGKMLCPMHLPVLLAGFLCGPVWAGGVGLIAPLLRHVLFGMPQIPTAFGMSAELLAYGALAGIFYAILPRKKSSIYIALLLAMLLGRVVWGGAMVIILAAGGGAFTWAAFVAGGFTTALPGIAVQLILIPILVLALENAGIIEKKERPEALH